MIAVEEKTMLTSRDIKKMLERERTPEGFKEAVRNHWKEHRPKLYRELGKSGELESHLDGKIKRVLEQKELIKKQLVEQSDYTPDQAERSAWELVREDLFLPSEEDVPNLGESPNPVSKFIDILASEKLPRTLKIPD